MNKPMTDMSNQNPHSQNAHAQEPQPQNPHSGTQDPMNQRLETLANKLDQAQEINKSVFDKAQDDDDDSSQSTRQAIGYALRLGTEMVAALLMGLGLGLGADYMFATSPFGLLIGLVLGMAAGVSNVWRVSMGMSQKIGYK